MSFCPFCNVENSDGQIICPYCDGYMAYNRNFLDKELVNIARGWCEATYLFCNEVLELDFELSDILDETNLTPIEILALDPKKARVYQLDTLSFELLVTRRINWVAPLSD